MNSSASITQEITLRLDRVRRKQLSIHLRSGAAISLTLSLVFIAAVVLAELLFRFSTEARTALFFLSLSVLLFALIRFLVLPILRFFGFLPSHDDLALARLVGDSFPSVRDRLLNLLQLKQETERGTRYSLDLIDASFHDLASVIAPLDFTESVNTQPARRAFRNLLTATAAVTLVMLMAPGGVSDSINRLLHYTESFIPPARYLFEVLPGNKEIVKGDAVSIVVSVRERDNPEGPIRGQVLLQWKSEDQLDFKELSLKPDSNGVFRTSLENVRNTTEYFVTFQESESDRYRLHVVDRPVLRSLQARLDYPPYTKLPPRVQEDFVADVSALPGTRVSISGVASKDLARGELAFGNGTKTPLSIRANRFSARFLLTQETTYRVEVTDTENLRNPDPIAYHLKIIPDEHPSVSIHEPGRNLDIAGSAPLSMLFQAKDDFGISRLRIAYRLAQSRYEPAWERHRFIDIPLPQQFSTEGEIRYFWNLSQLKLVPEDVVEYFAEVFDNDAVRGPKPARSPVYLLRLPSLEEVFTDLDAGHDDALENLREALEETQQLKEKIESVNQDFKKNKDPDWQQEKKLEETSQRYQKLQQKLDEVQAKLDQMLHEMQEQQVLSPETMEKYLELQQLFEQFNSAELQKALQQMQQAMQTISREQLQQALQQIQFSEERFRQSIERTMNLLKRIQIEQKLDELRKRAEELVAEQKQLQEEASRAETDPRRLEELAKKQENLEQKLAQMQERAEDVQNRMEEFFTEMPADKLNQLNSRLDEQRLGQRMREAAGQMRAGQTEQARQLQGGIQQQLENFAQQIDALQQEMLRQQAQQIISEMQKATENLLELSMRQELLKEQSRGAPQNSPQLRQNAQDQMRVMQELADVVDRLNELARRSFVVTPEMGKAIGEAMAKMQAAMRALDFRNGGMASQEQQAAMGALNKAAMSVQKALQSMMQQGAGMGGGLMGQLRNLAGQQMSLNTQTQLMQDAARLAVEQEAIRKSLEQLNKEAKASGEGERLLGDLERIAEEMKEVVRNLEQNDLNPETIRKQERILSRLLDASRSTRERDFEKKRKAQTGTPLARRGPRDLDPSLLEGRSRLREDLLKAIEQGYAKDYQELIRKYFEELEKIER